MKLWRNATLVTSAGFWLLLVVMAMDRLRDSGLESLETPFMAAATFTGIAVMSVTVSNIILKALRGED